MKRFFSVFFMALFVMTFTLGAPTQARAAEKQKKEISYVGDKQSKMYYPEACDGAKQVKAENLVKFSSKSEAKKAGYKLDKSCLK